MSIFNKKKPADQEGCPPKNAKTDSSAVTMDSVKILGSGCKKCNELEANTKDALLQLGIHTEIEHVTDFTQIASFGVMSTPALVVNSKVLSYGRVLKPREITALLQKTMDK
ncbi:MAG: thioredoxin family protein [Clostridiales bacterium 43-6]|nr:MAG: thioredoxin family protein [Clostridiales bacterium 43-6]